MSDTKHTPVPWVIKVAPAGADDMGLDIYGEDGEHWVACVWKLDQSDKVELPQIANAKLIVKAVNRHEELLQACILAHKILTGSDDIRESEHQEAPYHFLYAIIQKAKSYD